MAAIALTLARGSGLGSGLELELQMLLPYPQLCSSSCPSAVSALPTLLTFQHRSLLCSSLEHRVYAGSSPQWWWWLQLWPSSILRAGTRIAVVGTAASRVGNGQSGAGAGTGATG